MLGKYITKRSSWIVIVLALTGVGVMLFATSQCGIGISPDSVGYIATARHIAAGKGVVTYDNRPLIVYPPLYPTLLAVVSSFLGADVVSTARLVQAILFGLIIFLSGILFLRYMRNCVTCALLGTASVLVGYPLVQVSLMAWSEPLFIVLVLFYLLLSDIYVAQNDSIAILLLLAVSVALATLTRYVGALLVVTGLVSVGLAAFRSHTSSSKIKHALVLLLVSTLPLVLWLMRNYFLSGTLTGPRNKSKYSLIQNGILTLARTVSWYIPVPSGLVKYEQVLLSRTVGIAILGLLAATIAVSVFILLRRTEKPIRIRSISWELYPTIVFVVAYVGFLIFSSTWVAYDRISHRLLSPIYVPLTSLGFITWYGILGAFTGRREDPKFRNYLMVFSITVMLIYPTISAFSMVKRARAEGLGYNDRYWASSETIQYLQEHASECAITYTNVPVALYIRAGIVAKMSPRRTYYNSPDVANNLAHLKGTWPAEQKACLVWFDRVNRDYLFTIDDLGTIAHLHVIGHFNDGAVYFVEHK